MPYSIPIRQETMLSPAPVFLLSALSLGFYHPAPGTSPFSTHYSMPYHCAKELPSTLNKWHPSTLGWKAGLCPWHWELPQDLAGHATGLWFSEHFFWQQYQLKWPSALSSPITILPPLLTSSPGPPPQPSWYSCALGRETAPETGLTGLAAPSHKKWSLLTSISSQSHSPSDPQSVSELDMDTGCINHCSQRKKQPLTYTVTLWSEARASQLRTSWKEFNCMEFVVVEPGWINSWV